MSVINKFFHAIFFCPVFILSCLGGISFSALIFALIAQYGFGILPCELCLYQRIPFVVVVFLSVVGVFATRQMGAKYGALNVFFCAVALLINSGIAFYQVGVQESWWTSGCAVGDLSALSGESLVDAIKSAPAVSCSEKTWTFLGITFAGYNIVFSGVLGIFSLLASLKIIRKENGF